MTKKKKRRSGNNATFSDLKILVKEILSDSNYRKISHKQIIKKLGVKDKKTKNIIKTILKESTQSRPPRSEKLSLRTRSPEKSLVKWIM
jgi:hypothetical protein